MEADPVVLAGYVLDSPESHPGSAIRMARWIVQHAAIVAAAKAQEAAQRGHGRGTIGWSNACRATEFAVQAAQASSERAP